jgi:cobalt-zinc-cadmium efflux system membrane fusion protein
MIQRLVAFALRMPFIVLSGVLLALSVASACRGDPAASASEGSSRGGVVVLAAERVAEAKIAVVRVEGRPIDDSIWTSGSVTFDDLRVAHVFSPVTGRVAQINAALGERVKAGATLAVIQSPDLGQASSELAKADADLIAALHALKRKRALFVTKATSAADYEAAQQTFRVSRDEEERAAKKARLLRSGPVGLVSQRYALASPIEGEVITRPVTPGLQIQGQYSNGSVTELFTVGELDKVWVMADIYEADLARVALGAQVFVTVIAYPGRTFVGSVDWVSGTLDPATRTARVRCTFENPDRSLKPEMYATVRIAVPGRKMLAVPRSAIVKMGEQSVVFVEIGPTKGGIAYERVPVAVDDVPPGEFVAVQYGLEKGTAVVASGASALATMF